MKNRYRLIERRSRKNAFYCVDTQTGRRTSLSSQDRDAAEQIVLAKNQALRQPSLNLHIARAYLAGSDSGVATRTWRGALEEMIRTKSGSTRLRWETAAKDKALQNLLPRVIMETRGEDLLDALHRGTVSTNTHLRKLHNFCLAMTWLPWPLVPKPQWPAVRFREKRAISADEHHRIVEREGNRERRAFYELCWHLGGAQSDIAALEANSIDWASHVIHYARKKTGSVALVRFGPRVEAILRELPVTGPLFPYLRTVRCGDRATEFGQRCRGLGIQGVTLHSYRYAWAERAKTSGYPERFAQEALGHNSKAVHRAYARKAQVTVPPLEEYEAKQNLITFPVPPIAEPAGDKTPSRSLDPCAIPANHSPSRRLADAATSISSAS